jgi:hypothetical protein
MFYAPLNSLLASEVLRILMTITRGMAESTQALASLFIRMRDLLTGFVVGLNPRRF